MKRTLWLLFLICISTSAFGETDRGSWESLSGLQAGQKIQVSSVGAKTRSGRFVSFSDTAIVYRDGNGEQRIAKQDVRSVKLMDHKHRLRNTLIATGVGAGAGAAIGAATNKGCPSTESFCIDPGGSALPAAALGVVGAVGGAIVGFLLPSNSTIYHAQSP